MASCQSDVILQVHKLILCYGLQSQKSIAHAMKDKFCNTCTIVIPKGKRKREGTFISQMGGRAISRTLGGA